MNTNRNTERLFEKMREMPEEMPHEKVHQFVLAQAAIGITPIAASKGLAGIHKLFYKFHLNSMAIMTTAATASIISVFVLATSFHKSSDKINHHSLLKNKIVQTTLIPELSLATDTPKTETTKTNSTVTVTNGTNFSYTTVTTGKGTTNISVTTTNDSVITKVSSPNKDSTYTYSYSNHSGNSGSTILVFNNSNAIIASTTEDISKNLDDLSENMENLSIQLSDDADNVAKVTCTGKGKCSSSCSSSSSSSSGFSYSEDNNSEDSLLSKIEDALINDKLITDRKVYTFSITGKSLKVNGKKLDQATWEKYKGIIETNTHSTVDRKFEFSLSKSGDNSTIQMKNFAD